MSNSAQVEIDAGERFAFGQNWTAFLALVDDERITSAEESLRDKLGDLTGKRLLDVGSGSGLFSLAARNLGARVTSFDFDPQSVACTRELRRRYRADDRDWTITQGSALDLDFVDELGTFDVVYSWGVLHHTGDMWQALSNVDYAVAPGGVLFISIYNDQGRSSRNWKRIKRAYNLSGPITQRLIIGSARAHFWRHDLDLLGRLYRVANRMPRGRVARSRMRGMDSERDLIDWIGGWPFEVARPEQIFQLYRERGYTLDHLLTCAGGIGCNEFVFTKEEGTTRGGRLATTNG